MSSRPVTSTMSPRRSLIFVSGTYSPCSQRGEGHEGVSVCVWCVVGGPWLAEARKRLWTPSTYHMRACCSQGVQAWRIRAAKGGTEAAH